MKPPLKWSCGTRAGYLRDTCLSMEKALCAVIAEVFSFAKRQNWLLNV